MNRKFFDEARDAFHRELADTLHERAQESEFLSGIRRSITPHGKDMTTVHVSGGTTNSTMMGLPAEFQIQETALANGEVEDLRKTFDAAVSGLRSGITKHLFKVVGEAAAAVGNAVTVEGNAFTAEGIITMLERMEIAVDEKGNFIMPTIVVHPDRAEELEKLLDKPEVKFKIDAVMFQKYLERYAL